MIFTLINILIIFSYYLLVSKLHVENFSGKLVLIGLLSCAQIILTELILGIAGALYLSALILFNVVISAGIILYITLSYRSEKRVLHLYFKNDIPIVKAGLKSICAWENVILIGLLTIVSIWYFLCAYFLPPRGVDDLYYHLPPVYEYIITHKISLLPLTLGDCFAFPLNAEFLFMWPAIFSHSQRFITIVQFVAALFGVITIYALARMLYHKIRESFFVAVLFIFIPVVLLQAGSNDIDIITAVFFLVSLYLSAMFHLKNRLFYLYSAGISTGLMVGMKYTMVLLALSLQLFIVPEIFGKRRGYLFFLLILIFGGFWYLRNYFVLGNAFYPINLFNWGIFPPAAAVPSDIVIRFSGALDKLMLLYPYDAGLGTFNGGYGAVFWGICFPAWIYVLAGAFKRFRQEKFLFFFWLQGVFGFLILFYIFFIIPLPFENLRCAPRYSIYVVALGLLALGNIFILFTHNRFFLRTIKSLCVFSSLLSVMLIPAAGWPTYRANKPIFDFIKGKNFSVFRYFRTCQWVLPKLTYAWEPLDYLTRNDSNGLNCYVSFASSNGIFFIAPIYGSNLQNRIWNFQNNPLRYPDACVFYFGTEGGKGKTIYVGKKITFVDILFDLKYDLIAYVPETALFIKKGFLEQANTKSLLLTYYRETFPSVLKEVKVIKGLFEKDIPIVTSSSLGYGMKCLKLNNEINNEIYLVPQELEEEFVKKNSWGKVYTFDKPLPDFLAEEICNTRIGQRQVVVYKNTKIHS